MGSLEPGYRWLNTNSITTVYPSDGQGATTATASASDLANATSCTIYAIIIVDTPTSAVNTTVTITDGAGSDLVALKYQTTSSIVRIGDHVFGPRGILIRGGGFGVRVGDANLEIVVSYRPNNTLVQALVT